LWRSGGESREVTYFVSSGDLPGSPVKVMRRIPSMQQLMETDPLSRAVIEKRKPCFNARAGPANLEKLGNPRLEKI
jgi:hypothetical protein